MAPALLPALTAPMNYLQGFGQRAYPVVALAWGLIALSLIVCVIITVLVLTGTMVRRVHGVDTASIAPERGPGGLRWITIGLSLSLVALIGALIWTVQVLAAVNAPSRKPRPHHRGHRPPVVVGGALPGRRNPRRFSTANEIHIPAGEPVLLTLRGADVIHSFWVPALTGKTDTIPGRTNVSWIEADRPGTYRGQCTEYCGAQHAHMAVVRRRRTARGLRGLARGRNSQTAPPNPRSPRPTRESRCSSPTAGAATRSAAREAGGVARTGPHSSDEPPHHRRRRLPQRSVVASAAGSPIPKRSSPAC